MQPTDLPFNLLPNSRCGSDYTPQDSGTTPADWIAAQIPTTADNGATAPRPSDWLDRDFLRVYAQDADDSISLDEVRQAMSKIPGRLADDIRAERDER